MPKCFDDDSFGPLVETSNPLENLKKTIDDASNSGRLRIHVQNLPAAAPLFETGSIKELNIYGMFTDSWPSFLEKCHTLESLTLHVGKLTEFPSWIRNAVSLRRLSIEHPDFEIIPDWIGDLQFLTELSINYSLNWDILSDIKDKLNKRTRVYFSVSKKLKYLPDSIGNLKSLVKLDLSGLPIESLPDTIVNCASLEYVDIRQTNIDSPPNTISAVKTVRQSIKLIPEAHSISYRTFCNCYYRLAETIIRFSDKSRKDGLLSLEDDLKDYSDYFFSEGIRLTLDGVEAEIIRHILTLKIEREHGYYRKKLMEIAMEGILCIQGGAHTLHTAIILAALVDIKNNPLDAVLTKCYSDDFVWPQDIDFEAALQPEEEREEVRFIKRVMALSKIAYGKDLFSLQKHLDYDGIAARDIFEIGLCFVVNGTAYEEIDKILSILITHETDPVRKNFALAKKDAVLMINEVFYNPKVIKTTLLAYFDESIMKDLIDEL